MKLYLLLLGRIQPLGAPVAGYLVQTGDGRNMLIDSGLPPSPEEHPPLPPGWQFEVRREDRLPARLASLGLRPGDIHDVICTHLDADHAGQHDLFPQARFVVQRSHYEAAVAGHPRSAGTRPHWDRPELRYQLVEGDVEVAPGVELIETSGHVVGHQSVLVRLPRFGPVLLAIDAVPIEAMNDAATREIHPYDLDEASTRASTRKLSELARRERASLVIYGHDAEQWAGLRLAPEFYE